MLKVILCDMKCFLVMLFCFVIGFSQGFWLLLNDSPQQSDFGYIGRAYFTSFRFIFTSPDIQELDGSKSTSFAIVFTVAFMLTMLLLLLNYLIASMGNSFNRTKAKIEPLYWKEFALFMSNQSIGVFLVVVLNYCFGVAAMSYRSDELLFIEKRHSDAHSSHSQSNLKAVFARLEVEEEYYSNKKTLKSTSNDIQINIPRKWTKRSK